MGDIKYIAVEVSDRQFEKIKTLGGGELGTFITGGDKGFEQGVNKLIDDYVSSEDIIVDTDKSFIKLDIEDFIFNYVVFNKGNRMKASKFLALYRSYNNIERFSSYKERQEFYSVLRLIDGIELKISSGNCLYVYNVDIF